MKVTHTRITDAFGGGSRVVEHVLMSDLAEAWNASLTRVGLDPKSTEAVLRGQRLLAFAHFVRCSTWGDIYRAEYAREDLAEALAELGIDPAAIPPAPDTRPAALN